jgi:hypothetical protein
MKPSTGPDFPPSGSAMAMALLCGLRSARSCTASRRKPLFDKALWRAQAKAHLAAMPPSEQSSVPCAIRRGTDSPMDTLAAHDRLMP